MRGLHKTDIEVIMENALKENNIEVIPQFPIRCKYGYILDFAIPELKIDIECDGEHYHTKGNLRDNSRNWVLRGMGWSILRFRGKEIKKDINLCIERIKTNINERRLKLNGKNKSSC